MRYLLLIPTLELGGAERQAINFAEYLCENNKYVCVIGIGKPGKVIEICNLKKITCKSIGRGSFLLSTLLRIACKLKLYGCSADVSYYIPKIYWLKKYIYRERIDVCISYCTPANIMLGMYKSKMRKNQPLGIWYQRDAGIYDNTTELQKKAINSVDYILANGISGKKWIETVYGKKAKLIYNGVKLDPAKKTRKDWREQLGISDDEIACTMIANLSKTKDHMFLLKIWKALSERHLCYRLLLAGKFGNTYNLLNKYVEMHGLNNTVAFLGQVSDISGLISATDVCVFSAISEGSPNGIIESAMFGLPVVATDLPEIREVLSDINYELLFPKGNVEVAVKKIIKVAENKELRKQIGEANRLIAGRLFSPKTNFRKIVELVEADR